MQVFITFFKKNAIFFADIKKSITFALAIEKQTIAQMAESVDALVSNTSGATHPGSIPGLGTKRKSRNAFSLLLYPHLRDSQLGSAHGSPVSTTHIIIIYKQKDAPSGTSFHAF